MQPDHRATITARPQGLEIRLASDPDIPEVVSLLNRAYRASGTEAGWTTEAGLIDGDRISEATLRQQLAEKPQAALLVWKPGERVEGCVWLEETENGIWYLGSFAIDPQHQNAGYGRRLLQSAEEWISSHGGQAIKMTVIEERRSLIEWYERRGYRRTGESEPFDYSDRRFGTPRTAGLVFVVLTKPTHRSTEA